MSTANDRAVTLNGVTYQWPRRPVVVVCIDGGDPAYFDQAQRDGIIPNVERFMEHGFGAVADGIVPSLTNPNNLSIVTGSPPAVHGISGNYFLDPDTGAEVMMNDPGFVRSESLLAEFSQRKARVVAITAKDKLRRQLGRNIDLAGGSMNFSSEKADECTREANGIDNVLDFVGLPLPAVYSAELSLFVLEAGIRLLEQYRPELMYLSLTDYIQHKYAPGTPEINDFYAQLDDAFGRLAALGAVVGITADHGMNDKSKPDGSPNVIYLQDELDREFGPRRTRVILPITDPYVVHHGSLGGFARIYCYDGIAPEAVIQFAQELPGIEAVYDRVAVCAAFDLPPDREGDVAVSSAADTAIGASEATHDLSTLQGFRLRSHGGISERRVPFILSAPLNEAYAARAASGTPQSYEIYDYAINGVAV
ncbi:MAG: phosphonoacetate hydrolase [Dehalococcoidia bacterium]|nr:phosphonoacetate hydrolase [Dehalococcoidia bacterium]